MQGERTFPVAFTFYMMPDGRSQEAHTDVPHRLAPEAGAIIGRGWVFEGEFLQTGEVSLTVADPEEEIDIVCEVAPNDEELLNRAVERLIERGAKAARDYGEEADHADGD